MFGRLRFQYEEQKKILGILWMNLKSKNTTHYI